MQMEDEPWYILQIILMSWADPCTRNMTWFTHFRRFHLQIVQIRQSFEEFYAVNKIHLDWVNLFSLLKKKAFELSIFLTCGLFPNVSLLSSRSFLLQTVLTRWELLTPACPASQHMVLCISKTTLLRWAGSWKMTSFLSTFVKSRFFCLFILWGLYLPVNWPRKRYTEFRRQQIPCVTIKRVGKTALQRSVLSSRPMKYDTKIKVLDLIKPSAEITHFPKDLLPSPLTKLQGRKPQVWHPLWLEVVLWNNQESISF